MDAETFRHLMGHFATGVTVITTANDGLLHGMTANAVSSLSLDPPLVLVCVSRDAACYDQLAAAGRFALNILSAGQEDLSQLFARKEEPQRGSLRGASYRVGSHGSPLLEGCLAYLECQVTEQVAGGDHDVFFGAVLAGGVAPRQQPLLFYQGTYRLLSPA